MFGLKEVRIRLERIEGSLLWIARELSGPAGLQALQAQSAALRSDVETLRETLARAGTESARISSDVQAVRDNLARAGEESARISSNVQALREHLERAVREAARQAQDVSGIAQTLGELQSSLTERLGRGQGALEGIRQTLSHLDESSALRAALHGKGQELEVLGEQALRLVELLHDARRELAALRGAEATLRGKNRGS
jgi:predicted  nucleic acid-binding Zn-ribbon protein